MAKPTKAKYALSLGRLRERLPDGSTVYTILRHTSRNWTVQDIGPVAIVGDTLRQLDEDVSVVLGLRWVARRDAVRIHQAAVTFGSRYAGPNLVHRLECILGVTLIHRSI